MTSPTGPGATRWVIAEGYIPAEGTGPEPQMTSHETVCILNAGDTDAHVRLTTHGCRSIASLGPPSTRP